jgi:hypothetical protein
MIRWGSTRAVLPIGQWAFKFSRNEYGARCNRYEADLYHRCRNKPHRRAMLCPVLWCSPSGRLLIARRAASPLTAAQVDELNAWDFSAEWDYLPPDDEHPFEPKPDNWGMLDGGLVAVDYATPVLCAGVEQIIADRQETT